ncbi:hypothetical protein [Cutibacterium equinum]|uniref:hypothetical protein n=1 Tax=Cutibacterium equinum TaxID=3016342 RepID=UPI002FDFEE4A
MRLEQLVLTPGGVLAVLDPTGGDADQFRTYTLGRELGPDAHREGPISQRDLWYASLLHFRGPILQPHELVTWVRSHPTSTAWTFPKATLCTYRTTTTAMLPNTIHTAAFRQVL